MNRRSCRTSTHWQMPLWLLFNEGHYYLVRPHLISTVVIHWDLEVCSSDIYPFIVPIGHPSLRIFFAWDFINPFLHRTSSFIIVLYIISTFSIDFFQIAQNLWYILSDTLLCLIRYWCLFNQFFDSATLKFMIYCTVLSISRLSFCFAHC